MAEHDDFFDDILRCGPSAGSLFLVLTRMKDEGRLNEVVQACIRFLTFYPDDVRLRILLADSYADMGFVTLAQIEFEKAAELIDDMAPVYRSLADLYAKQHRQSEAADMLRRYLAHYPGQADALAFLGRLETAPGSEAFLSEEEDVSAGELVPPEEESDDAVVDFASPTIAELYYSQGRIDAAIHTYEKVLDSNPEDVESLRRLNQLKGMLRESPDIAEIQPGPVRSQKERMITILERWLPRVREIRYA